MSFVVSIQKSVVRVEPRTGEWKSMIDSLLFRSRLRSNYAFGLAFYLNHPSNHFRNSGVFEPLVIIGSEECFILMETRFLK